MSEETRTMQTADTTPARGRSRAGKEYWQDHLQGARPFQPDQHGNHERQNQAYAQKRDTADVKHSGSETFKQASGPFRARRKGAEVNPLRLHFRETV